MIEEGKNENEGGLGEEVTRELELINKIYLSYTEKDEAIDRKDTAAIIVELLKKIQAAISKVLGAGETAREKLFWVLYNGSIQIVSYCRALRESSHSQKVIEFLAFAVAIIDGNLILMKAKYLQWRVRVYSELAGAYEDLGAAVAAKNVITYGRQQVEYLRELEEQDPPVPESTDTAICEALRILNALELKYSLQSGQMKPDAWKKRLQESYSDDIQSMALAVVESLTTSVRKASAVIGYKKGDIPQWKAEAVGMAVDLLEPEINVVTKALQEQIEQKEREKTKQEEIDAAVEAAAKAAQEAALRAEQEKAEEKKTEKKEVKKAAKEKGKKGDEDKDRIPSVDEIVEKYKEMDNKMIKERVWKEASKNVPFEVHVELIKLCFQVDLKEKLDRLIESAYIRLKYRRVEVPYVTGVDILASIQKDPIIPNGFDLLPDDLNSLHLKQELTKLRASQQSMTIKTEVKKDNKGKKVEKKEEKKKEDKKKPEEKKKAGKGGKKEEKGPPKKKQAKQELALESELAQIKHTYVRLIVERSRNPTNAMIGLAVKFGDPLKGVFVEGKETPVVIPLSGEDEDAIPPRLPFVIFKRTSNALKDEDEQLSMITDVQCIVSRDPFMLPPVGYIKIPVDLRENPLELVGLGNREYIYIAYKTEREFRMAERDIEIIKNLLEVERSVIDKSSEGFNKLIKAKRELNLNFDMDMLVLLGSILRDAIMGPIGDMYMIDRQDMLFDIVSHLWRKYLEPVLKCIDFMEELDAHGELLDYISFEIKDLIADTLKAINGTILAAHRILNKLKMVDPVLYSEVTLQAGELSEKLHEYRTSIQVLRSGVSKIVEYRENMMKMGADGKENLISSMYITCNNYTIDGIEKKMKNALQNWEDQVLREERQRQRKQDHKMLLEPDEADHEFHEIKQALKEKLPEEDEQGGMMKNVEKHKQRYYSDLEGLLVALHGDMVVSLYRNELKLGSQMEGIRNQTTRVFKEKGIEAPDYTKGVSSGLKAKMTIGKGATATKIKIDQKDLETTLHEAGKLPPPKPPLVSYEAVLTKEANKNPYLNAIVSTQLAIHKNSSEGGSPEQQFLLMEALKWAMACEEMEHSLSELMVNNAVYVQAARQIHGYEQKSIVDAYPFYFLKNYVPKAKCPQKPILISRASTSISMMLPFFRSSTPGLPQVKTEALYGKVSVSGVGVSLNNTDYEGTGERLPFGSVVTVPGLLPHEKYVFAAAGFSAEGDCPHGIGETSDEIVALIPLSVLQIFSYLADVAYKLKAHDIARQAAEKVCQKVIVKNELRCNLLDTRINPILAFQLNKDYINLISLADIRCIANAFLILGRSLVNLRSKRLAQAEAKGISPSLVKIDSQKISLKVCNYLILGIEAASRVKDYYLLKLLVIQIYNTLVEFFQSETQSPLLLHALIKCHVAVTLIPANQFDSATRAVASCISYQVAIATLQTKESNLLASVIRNDLSVMRRRWMTKSSRRIVPPQPLTAEEEKKKAEQEKKLSEGQEIPKEELVRVPEPSEEPYVTLFENEKEGAAIDEFFLTLGEYNERIALNAGKWKALLRDYVDIVTDGEKEIGAINATIDGVVQFWKNVAAGPATALDALLKEGRKTNPRYLEFGCKVLRRMLETTGWSETTDLISDVSKVEIDEEISKEIEDSLKEQVSQLENDVLERAVKRLSILEKVCANDTAGIKEEIIQKVISSLQRTKSEVAGGIISKNQKPSSSEEENRREQQKWVAELFYLRGSAQFEKFKKLYGVGNSKVNANYFEIRQLDFDRIKLLLEDDFDRLSKTEVSPSEQLLKEIIETHARGALYALQSHSSIILHNLIVQIWNILLYVQASPSLHKKLESWSLIVILSYCILSVIGVGKSGEKQVHFSENKKNKKSNLLYANFISYATQCMLMVEKWQSLADLCQRFNARTYNEYGSFLLPFAIFAQSVLYTRSEQNTLNKKEELKTRIEAFEKWAATKKKKSRAAMITGEIPPEEQEFLKDRARLTAEIMKLEIIQKFCFEDKAKNDELLALIKRDSNTAREGLINCRKGLIDYAQKTCELYELERAKGSDSGDVRKLRKVHQMITNKIVGSYKKIIEVLRERQENFMLIQALHELGNIYFAEGQLREAEINWSDSLDTVYQELYVLNNFRAVIKKTPNLVAKFGMKQCLTSLILISKLHKFTYRNDLNKRVQAIEMALHISFEPFKLAIPHPQQFNLFSLYRCTEILPSIDLFDDNYELSGSELLQALDYLTGLALDYEEYERGLPALALMQYVSRKGCFSNKYIIRMRAKLAVALAQIGNIQEAILVYNTLIQNKDLVSIGSRDNPRIDTQKYSYSNGVSPYDEPNKSTLAEIVNAELDKSAFESYNFAYIRFAKCIILARAFENECLTGTSAVERQDERVRTLKRVEEELKEVMRSLARLDEIATRKQNIIVEGSKFETDAKMPEDLQEKQRIIEKLIEEEGLDIQVGGEIEYLDIKNDLLSLIVHCRILTGKIYQYQGLFSDQAQALGIISYKTTISMIPEGIIAGVGAAPVGKDRKAPGQKEEKKKAPAGKKEAKKSEEKYDPEKRETEIARSLDARNLFVVHLWLKLKSELLQTLYFQSKFDDCEALIKNILEESDTVKDAFFRRLALQIRCYILIHRGKFEEGKKLFEDIVKHAKQFGQSDSQFAVFLGNIGEFIFKQHNDSKLVLDYFKESRIIMWQLLKNYGIEIEPIDINQNNYKNGIFINPEGYFKEEAFYNQAGDKVIPEIKKGPIEEIFDYSNEVTVKLKFPEIDKNSSYVAPNLYVRFLDQLIKFDSRYALIAISDANYETAVRVLGDTIKLAKRTLNLSPAQVISAYLLDAFANKQIFKAQIAAHEASYVAKAKTNRKYEAFAKAVPYGKELSLGDKLYSIPMFAHKLRTEYWKYIERAYEDLREAVKMLSEESVLLFDFNERYNSSRAFFEYADVCRLMVEYLPRPNYLFFDYQKNLKERIAKENPKFTPEEIEKKFEEDLAKEQQDYELKKGNLFSESLIALEQACKCDAIQKLLSDGYPDLSQTTLIDPSRAPKDIIIEIFEADYHFKKKYKDHPAIESKPKTALTSADLLCYFLSLANEMKIFTFNKEIQAKRLSKLHRYLKSNLSTYASQCCISFKPYANCPEQKDLYALKPNGIVSMWISNPISSEVIQLYMLGPKEGAEEKTVVGSLRVPAKELGKLYQDAQALLKSFVDSSTKSPEVFERDKSLSKEIYFEIIWRIADMFAPRIVNETYREHISKVVPEFTEKNLRDIVDYLAIFGKSTDQKELCSMLRLFHSIRFKLL